ncbi:MAG: heme NO-binding domain-containing protein [Xanthomonadales bacterium]|nr:heme NO-binding domain-containing protein [Xanthomonadales bacterium]
MAVPTALVSLWCIGGHRAAPAVYREVARRMLTQPKKAAAIARRGQGRQCAPEPPDPPWEENTTMYGLVNNAIRSMILENHGPDRWRAVLAESGVPDDSFLAMRSYDDSITYGLVVAASKNLGVSVEDCLQTFGEYWVLETASKAYPELMATAGRNLVEFLGNLNSMHDRIAVTFIEFDAPEFRVEHHGGNHYRVHYLSRREGLTAFVAGLLNGLAKRFGSRMQLLSQTLLPVASGTHAVFEVAIE